ncbi:hypothetical protein ACOME3_006381 [Neoechinorhynchus agilis]
MMVESNSTRYYGDPVIRRCVLIGRDPGLSVYTSFQASARSDQFYSILQNSIEIYSKGRKTAFYLVRTCSELLRPSYWFQSCPEQKVICIASDNDSLLALNDTHGRIFIFDHQRNVIVRLLKGYREVGLVWENSLLHIYAPLKNLIEV